jgi:CheY-like chemotaxis protein
MKSPRGRVLVVEDEPYVRRSLLDMLESRRFDVAPSSSGVEALSLLAKTPVDVVLSDLRMRDMDGLELVRRLRASGATRPSSSSPAMGTSPPPFPASRPARTTSS